LRNTAQRNENNNSALQSAISIPNKDFELEDEYLEIGQEKPEVQRIKKEIQRLKDKRRDAKRKGQPTEALTTQIQEHKIQLKELQRRIRKGKNPDKQSGMGVEDVKDEDAGYNYSKNTTKSMVTGKDLDFVPKKIPQTKTVTFTAPIIPLNNTIEGNISTKTFNVSDNTTSIDIIIKGRGNQFHSYQLISTATNRLLWSDTNHLTANNVVKTITVNITKQELTEGNFVFTNIYPNQNLNSNDIQAPPMFPEVRFIENGKTIVPTGETIKILTNPNQSPTNPKKK
jgi:hypothetical protein